MFVTTDWIAKRYEERERRAWLKRTISQCAPALYNQLWDAIVVCIGEAQKHKETIITNGEPLARKAYLSVLPLKGQSFSPPRELGIFLRDDSIHAKIGVKSVMFEVGLDQDNIGLLLLDGTPISVNDAAEKIMDSYLFPDLADEED